MIKKNERTISFCEDHGDTEFVKDGNDLKRRREQQPERCATV